MASRESLRVSEIFYSVQGESTRVGLPTIFIRLTGCPLRCRWCDTSYAFTGGQALTVDEVLDQCRVYNCRTVCVTGGEPLAQKPALHLLRELCDAGHSVSLETSGALDISTVDPRVSRIVDLKAPDSGEVDKNCRGNIQYLKQSDEIKFVLASERDYVWAKQQITQYQLIDRCPVLMSPVDKLLTPTQLADWILSDQLNVRLQIQLHKIIWGNERGR